MFILGFSFGYIYRKFLALFKEEEMKLVGEFIHRVLSNRENEIILDEVKQKVKELSANFPIYDFI